ncbi:hypothetical protein U9M48_000823 [Paspalum notatum var. saurae]|uniref:Uncharacterized protein n=1 Tax=Paspalum notatum var. saurae TaxID=547442 RepID=A0AAQ3PIJ7_PASNO
MSVKTGSRHWDQRPHPLLSRQAVGAPAMTSGRISTSADANTAGRSTRGLSTQAGLDEQRTSTMRRLRHYRRPREPG